MKVGSLELDLLLDRTNFDRTIREAERDAQTLGTKRVVISPSIDHRKIKTVGSKVKTEINGINRWLNGNPITPQVDLSQLENVHKLMDMSGGTLRIEAEIKHNGKDQSNCCDGLERAITENTGSVTELLREIADNTKKDGLVKSGLKAVAGNTFGATIKGGFFELGGQFSQEVTKQVRNSQGGKQASQATARVAARVGNVGVNASANYAEKLFGASRSKGNAIETMANDIVTGIESLVDPTIFSEKSTAIRRKYLEVATKIEAGHISMTEGMQMVAEATLAAAPRQIRNAAFRTTQVAALPLKVNKEYQNAKAARLVEDFTKDFERVTRTVAKHPELSNLKERGIERVGIAIGGHERKKGTSSQQLSEMLRPFMDEKTAFVEIKNTFTDRFGGEAKSSSYDTLKEILEPLGITLDGEAKSMLSNLEVEMEAAFKGMNPDAIKASVIKSSIKALFPDLDVFFAGFSGGGFPVEQAVSISEAGGDTETKGIGVGSPFFNLTDTASPEQFKSVVGYTDPLTFPYNKEGIGYPDTAATRRASKGASGIPDIVKEMAFLMPSANTDFVSPNDIILHDIQSYLGNQDTIESISSFIPGFRDFSPKLNLETIPENLQNSYADLIPDLLGTDNLLYGKKQNVRLAKIGKANRFLNPKDQGSSLDNIEAILDKPKLERSDKEIRTINSFVGNVTEQFIKNLDKFESEIDKLLIDSAKKLGTQVASDRGISADNKDEIALVQQQVIDFYQSLYQDTDSKKFLEANKARVLPILDRAADEKLEGVDTKRLSGIQKSSLSTILAKRESDDIKLLKGLDIYKNGGTSDIDSDYEFFNFSNPEGKIKTELGGLREYAIEPNAKTLKGTEFEEMSSSYARFLENMQAALARFVATGEKIPDEFIVAAEKILTAEDKLATFDFPDLIQAGELKAPKEYFKSLAAGSKRLSGETEKEESSPFPKPSPKKRNKKITAESDDFIPINPFDIEQPERDLNSVSNPLVSLHQNTNDKLDSIINLLMGNTMGDDGLLPEINLPESVGELIRVGDDKNPDAGQIVRESVDSSLDASKGVLKSMVNGIVENFDGLYRESQKWEKAFLDLAPGQTGQLAKKATQYTALPIATTFAATGIPGLEQAIAVIHGLADLGLHDMAQGLANGVMDSISRSMPDAFGSLMDQLQNAPLVGDYFTEIRQIPQQMAESASDYVVGNAGRTIADIGIGSGIIKGGKDVYDGVGNKLNPDRQTQKDQEILDRVQDHLRAEYKEKPITADSPEITQELETLKLEQGFEELEKAASDTAEKLKKLFSVEGLRRLAPMTGIPTTYLAGDKPIKSAKKNDIASAIARLSPDVDIDTAIANSSPDMFLKQYKDMGRIKPEIDLEAFENLKRYWKDAIDSINSTPLDVLNTEEAIAKLDTFATGYVKILNERELTGKQRQSTGGLHGNADELKTALKAFSQFENIEDLSKKFQDGASKAGKHWGNTTKDILKQFQILRSEAKEKGYDIQKALSKGSPGMLTNLEKHWDNATDSVKDNLSEIESAAQTMGSKIGGHLEIEPDIGNYLEQEREAARQSYRQNYRQIPIKNKLVHFEKRSDGFNQYIKDLQNKYKQIQDLAEGALVPYIYAEEDSIQSILENGYRPNTERSSKDYERLRDRKSDKGRPDWADPTISPIHGFVAPYKFQGFANGAEFYGGQEPALMRLNSSILEKSTLTMGNSRPGTRFFPATPTNARSMFEDTIDMDREYLEFQFWGNRSPKIDEIYFPKQKPLLTVQNAALENNIPLFWNTWGELKGQRPKYDYTDDPRSTFEGNNLEDLKKVNFASKNPLNELEKRFGIGAENAQRHWKKSALEILKQFDILAIAAKKKGYDIQRYTSEGSPGPSERVRANWSKTAKHLKQQFEYIREQAKIPGSEIEKLFTADPDLLNTLDEMETKLDQFASSVTTDYKLEVALEDENIAEQVEKDFQAIAHNLDDVQIGQSFTFDTDTATAGFSQLNDSLDQIHRTSLDSRYLWQQIAESASNFAVSLQEGEDPLGGLESAYDVYASAIDNLPDMGDIFSGVSQFIDEMSEASPVFEQVVGFVKDLGISALGILGFSELGDVISESVVEIIDYGREFQRFERSITSAGKNAARVYEDLIKQSQKYGISLQESMAGYTQLTLSVQGTGNQEVVDEIFPGFQKAFASRQSTSQQQGRGFLAIEQMLSKGNAAAEELRQQLSDALPGAFAIAAQSMGMDMQEFTIRLYTAQIAAKDLLTRMAAFYEIDSQILLAIASDSFEAELNRLTNNLDILKTSGGEILIPVLTPGLEIANLFLTTLSKNLEIVSLIAGGVFLGVLAQVAKSLWNVATATKANTLLAKTMGLEYAQQTAKMAGAVGNLNKVALGTARVAGKLWGAFAVPTIVIAGISRLFEIIGGGSEEMKAALKVAKDLKKLGEEGSQDDDPNTSNFYQGFFSKDAISDSAKSAVRQAFDPRRWFKGTDRESDAKDLRSVRKSIKPTEDTVYGIRGRVGNMNIPQLSEDLKNVDSEILKLQAKRLVLIENSEFDKLANLDERLGHLTEDKGEIIKSVSFDLSLANKALKNLEVMEEFLTEKLDKSVITEESYRRGTDIIKRLKGVALGSINTIDAALDGLTTNIAADFANFAEDLDNFQWSLDGEIKQESIDNMRDKLSGDLSKIDLETLDVRANVVKSSKTAARLTQEADTLKERILDSDDTYLQDSAITRLQLDPYLPLSEQFGEISNLSEQFISDMATELEEVDKNLSDYLRALATWTKTADDAATATQEAERANLEGAAKIKENAASYRDFAISLRDLSRSREDVETERQRFAEDFPLQIKQAQTQINRAARDIAEQYQDFINDLEQQLIQTRLELAELDQQIADNNIDISLLKQFKPGSSGFGKDIAQLYADYFKAINQQETTKLESELTRLDLEQQTLENSRRIRDLAEQRVDQEYDRLEQLRNLARQQEDFERQQKRTWEDTLEQMHGIELQAGELGVSLDEIAGGVAEQGNGLINALNHLAKSLVAESEQIRGRNILDVETEPLLVPHAPIQYNKTAPLPPPPPVFEPKPEPIPESKFSIPLPVPISAQLGNVPQISNFKLPTAPESTPQDFSGNEEVVKQSISDIYQAEKQKLAKTEAVKEQEQAIALLNLINGLAEKQKEMAGYFRNLRRQAEDRKYEIEQLNANAKGYLTDSEQVRFAGIDTKTNYQGRIRSLEDEQLELMNHIQTMEDLIAPGGLLDEAAQEGNQDAIKTIEQTKQDIEFLVDDFIAKNKIQRQLRVEILTSVDIAETNKALELDFNKRAQELGLKSEIISEKQNLGSSFIRDLSFNDNRRSIGEAEIKLDYQQQLKDLEKYRGEVDQLGDVYARMKDSLDELNQAKLDNLAKETNNIVQIFDEVAQPALNGLLDDFISSSVSAEDAWRSFTQTILNSLADILMSFAKNELLKTIFGDTKANVPGVDISGKTQQKAGVDFSDVVNVGLGAASNFSQPNSGVANQGGGGWQQALGMVASISSLFFSKGGDTEAMHIPHASNGLDTSDLSLALGIKQAMRNEAHPEAFPAVLHKGEVVMSDLTGDAQLVRKLRSTGEWQQMKTEGYQPAKVDNYRYGSEGAAAMFRGNGGGTTIIQNTPITVHAKDANSFKETEDQIYRRQKLRQDASKR